MRRKHVTIPFMVAEWGIGLAAVKHFQHKKGFGEDEKQIKLFFLVVVILLALVC